jgi:Tfp pilus assembly protein PilO
VKAPKAPYILTAVGVFLAALLVYAFAYMPQINAAKDLDAQRLAVAGEDDALQHRADLVAAKVKDLPAVQAKVADFSKAVPSSPAQKELIAAILDAGSSSGVTVTGINPVAPAAVTPDASAAVAGKATSDTPPATPPAPAAGAATDPASAGPLFQVGLTINATGDQQNLLVFLQKVESMKRPFTATEVTMTQGEGNGILVMTGNSFMVSPLVTPQPPAAAGTTPAPAPGATDAPSPSATTQGQ